MHFCNTATKEVGLVLNFEARGPGPSYMLMETNKGNAGLVKNLLRKPLFQVQILM
jgi:hypothetical protein